MKNNVNTQKTLLGDLSFEGFNTALGKLSVTQSIYWGRMIFEAARTDNTWTMIDRSYLEKHIRRSKYTISRCTMFFEKLGVIEVNRVKHSDNNICITHNYYRINIKRAFEVFGEHFIGAAGSFVRDFFKRQMAKFSSSSCDAFCVPNITNSYINTNENALKEAADAVRNAFACYPRVAVESVVEEPSEEAILNEDVGLDVIEENRAPDPTPEPNNEWFEEEEPTRTYFDRSIKVCPEEWRAIAVKESLKEMYIDEEFEDFRDYWIGQGKVKAAKKSNWVSTWRNRIRSIVNSPRTAYKVEKPEYNFNLIQNGAKKPSYEPRRYEHSYTSYRSNTGYRPPVVHVHEEQEIDLDLKHVDVNHLKIHKQLLDALGKPNYVSYIQKQAELVEQSDGTYGIKFANGFIKSRMKTDPMFRDVFETLNVTVY